MQVGVGYKTYEILQQGKNGYKIVEYLPVGYELSPICTLDPHGLLRILLSPSLPRSWAQIPISPSRCRGLVGHEQPCEKGETNTVDGASSETPSLGYWFTNKPEGHCPIPTGKLSSSMWRTKELCMTQCNVGKPEVLSSLRWEIWYLFPWCARGCSQRRCQSRTCSLLSLCPPFESFFLPLCMW